MRRNVLVTDSGSQLVRFALLFMSVVVLYFTIYAVVRIFDKTVYLSDRQFEPYWQLEDELGGKRGYPSVFLAVYEGYGDEKEMYPRFEYYQVSPYFYIFYPIVWFEREVIGSI